MTEEEYLGTLHKGERPELLSVGYLENSQGNLTEVWAREQKEPGFNL